MGLLWKMKNGAMQKASFFELDLKLRAWGLGGNWSEISKVRATCLVLQLFLVTEKKKLRTFQTGLEKVKR